MEAKSLVESYSTEICQ